MTDLMQAAKAAVEAAAAAMQKKIDNLSNFERAAVAADKGFSKDGAVTNFVQNYVPAGGFVTAAVHAAAGNNDYAEYAAVKGLSTAASTAISAVGVLGGPAGEMLASGLGSIVGTTIEGSMKGLLKPSVKDKLSDLTLEGVATSFAFGVGTGMLGPAGRALKGTKPVASALSKLAASKPVAQLTTVKYQAAGWISGGRLGQIKAPMQAASLNPPTKLQLFTNALQNKITPDAIGKRAGFGELKKEVVPKMTTSSGSSWPKYAAMGAIGIAAAGGIGSQVPSCSNDNQVPVVAQASATQSPGASQSPVSQASVINQAPIVPDRGVPTQDVPGGLSRYRPPVVSDRGVPTEGVSEALSRSAELMVKVYHAQSKQPLGEATLRLRRANESLNAAATSKTDAAGQSLFETIAPADDYQVLATMAGYQAEGDQVQLRAGESKELVLYLTPDNQGKAIGASTSVSVPNVVTAPAEAVKVADTFGAIAFSVKTGKWGYASGCDTQQQAELHARENCKADDAQAAVWVKNGYCALIFDENYAYGAGFSIYQDASAAAAKKMALEELGKVSKTVATAARNSVCISSKDEKPEVFPATN